MSDDESKVVTLKIRVAPEFREKIVSTAKENNRSMNQEIVSRLEQSFNDNLPVDVVAAYKAMAEENQTLLRQQIMVSNMLIRDLAKKLDENDPLRDKIFEMLGDNA